MDINSMEMTEREYEKIPQYAKSLNSIFDYNKDVEKTAFLNWRFNICESNDEQFIAMGNAFFDTAYNMIQQCLQNNTDKKADSWIFPILFNIVHATEIYLKAINASLADILNEDIGITYGGHNLRLICIKSRELINAYKNKMPAQNQVVNEMLTANDYIKNFIDNIYAKTNDMTFARYPLDKRKDEHFYTPKQIGNSINAVVDLETLAEQVKILYNLLDFTYTALNN